MQNLQDVDLSKKEEYVKKAFFGDSIIINNEITGMLDNVTYAGTIIEPGYCDIQFKDSNGSIFRHREWTIDTTREDHESRSAAQALRVKHMLHALGISDENMPTETEDSKFWVKATELLEGNTTPLRVKLVFKNNYLSFPPYVPFMERMDVEKTSLQFSSKEILKRVLPDKTPTEPVKNDLPF